MNHKKPRRRLYVMAVVVTLFLLISGFIVTNLFFADKRNGFSQGLKKAKGVVSFLLLGNTPGFYFIDMEKNGKDYRLTASDIFDVSYRDEFVIKDISTDAILNRHITVDVEGMGEQNDFRMLLRGIDLVDRVVMSNRIDPASQEVSAGSIHIKYRNDIIASIPMRVVVTPQDWLRYAKSSEDRQKQIEYLKKAITTNREDVGVRKMLAALYSQSGMVDRAIAQYQEILTLKPDDSAAMTDLFNCYVKIKAYDLSLIHI